MRKKVQIEYVHGRGREIESERTGAHTEKMRERTSKREYEREREHICRRYMRLVGCLFHSCFCLLFNCGVERVTMPMQVQHAGEQLEYLWYGDHIPPATSYSPFCLS